MSINATAPKLDLIRKETANDPILAKTMVYTIDGWPNTNEILIELRDMYAVRNNLSVVDGLLFYEQRIVIPSVMRKEMLMRLHNGHMGITKCRLRAQETMWWPKISRDIQDEVESCSHCQINKPAQRSEPLITRPLPDRPWQRICADLLTHKGKMYLVMFDEYSRWLEIVFLRFTTSHAVVMEMMNVFTRWGFPENVTCDNGPQFASSEFQKFAHEKGFEIQFSSPRYPQSNGGAETGVRLAKKILAQNDPFTALMEYRATPTTVTLISPCELLQGREMNTTLPILPEKLVPKVHDREHVRNTHDKAKENQAKYFDKRNSARTLKTLQIGDDVRLKTDEQKHWSSPGKVIDQYDPRSYIVQVGDGLYRRNRRHIQSIPPTDPYKPIVFPLPPTPVKESKSQPSNFDPPMVRDNSENERTVEIQSSPVKNIPDRPVRSTRNKLPNKLKDFVT